MVLGIIAIIFVILWLFFKGVGGTPEPEQPKGHWKDYEHKHVYIISNPAWPGWYKVGISINDHKRLGGYQTGDPHRSYELEYSLYTPFWDSVEKEMHLSKNIEVKYEWMKAPLPDLKKGIHTLHENYRQNWETKMKN